MPAGADMSRSSVPPDGGAAPGNEGQAVRPCRCAFVPARYAVRPDVRGGPAGRGSDRRAQISPVRTACATAWARLRTWSCPINS
ncbi:hypothetical protein GCM10018980_17740 [Streptomyces capoamus]|uniref:Uncharacterized protein n=1 Tax=Streptomyces capoamus TaxID=68183 RepID=A0A919EW74_9ACTN|nr:hypothetical protein GCM10010501_31350 [Streptomyces libani subsp. rufus]GHG42234.1 hypothetical protein GCM10018980_17740 [Streptomyces capoamus]